MERKKKESVTLLACMFLGSSLSVYSQNDTIHTTKNYRIDEVVVTGTRSETDIRHLPMTVSVVGRKQIEDSYQPSLLPTLVQQVPGLFITGRGVMGYGVSDGAAGSMNLRGIGGAAGMLILIDGSITWPGFCPLWFKCDGWCCQHCYPKDTTGRSENRCPDRLRLLQHASE